MARAIGIDLGTTNSCAAVIENGRPRVITHKGGETTIPSVFAVDEQGRELVGHEARRQAQLNPANTVMASKRLIGRNFHSKTIDKVRQIFTYEMMEGEQDDVVVKVQNRVFTLEQISAAILARIREVAEEALDDDVDEAVITVPAYFNDRQRQAVRNAGRLAGLKVLRILNEPTAAALAYGMGRRLNQRVAVYDLGGGTFDISIIDIKDRIFEVIATGGDTFLGGVDFDDRLMQYVLEDFLDRTNIDLAWDRVAVQRIRDAAEQAKIELSTLKRTRIQIPFITQGDEGPLGIDLEVSREELEELTGDLVERTIRTCERILREAGTTREQLDEVLLVGGQSRMPLVQRKVSEFMGRPPSKGVHPDEAVAIGAAIMAHSLGARGGGSDVTLLDVLPMPIGINKVDGTMHVLFQKNQPLPDYKTRTLTTSKDDQKSIMLRIYQGESRLVAENELLGTFIFSGLRPAPRGGVQIEVTFHIDSEGILNLSARDKETGQSVASTLRLGKGRKKRKKRRKAAPQPARAVAGGDASAPTDLPSEGSAPTAPAPLDMPRSSLAEALGGGPLRPPEAHEPTAPTTVAKPEADPTHAPTDPGGPDGGPETAGPEAAAEPEAAGTPRDDAPAADEPAAGAADVAGKAAGEKPGAWGRVMGWFRKLFGGS